MDRTVIDSIYDDNKAVVNFLNEREEISLASDMDNKLKKLLLLSAASYFESEIQDAMRQFVARTSNNNGAMIGFVVSQAIERKYHTYFSWEAANANKFFGMFGEQFSKHCKQEIESQESLRTAAKAFLELGRTRNELAHLNFASFPIDKTASEIYDLYQKAYPFLEFVKRRLQEA